MAEGLIKAALAIARDLLQGKNPCRWHKDEGGGFG
jgi:hypothetical protein